MKDSKNGIIIERCKMFKNPFVLDKNEYKRDINFLKHYIQDSTYYLSIMTGKTINECRAFIEKRLISDGNRSLDGPVVECLIRNENGDRDRVKTTLSQYLNDAIRNNEIIAPTLTTYLNPSEKVSLLSTYIDVNVKARSVAKKAMFAAGAAGDKLLESIKRIEQTNKKLANNSISGAHVSPSNPLYNKTAHSTLTSNCRSTAGYGNANNEKMLSGNRHYWSHDIVLNNIVSIVTHTDYALLESVINKHKLYLPTVEDTLECIRYSTNLYWWERTYFKKIGDLVDKLTPLQRAAFVYTGDLYHLKKHNDKFVRDFINILSFKVKGIHPDPDKQISQANEAVLNLAHQICATETKGIGKNYTTIKDTPAYHTLALTILNIESMLTADTDLIKALFVSDNVPASMAYFPESIRRCVLTGDTDSTIFTVQDWVMWYKGGISFDDEAISVAATLIFLASATISHVLAIMSANFGIVEDRIHQIEMKNEFKFEVFVPTQLGKHYFATISCQEGNVFDKRKMEIKGVYLKSSNAPKIINKMAVDMMNEIMQTVIDGKKISIIKYLRQLADIERSIIDSIHKGEFTYLRTGSIKDSGSYTKEETMSPYQNHLFWQAVFGPKYGIMENPPYNTMKVSVTIDSSIKMKQWIKSIDDRDLADRLNSYMLANGKVLLTTMNIPAQILTSVGMPKEIISIIDYRKIVSDIVKIYYIILECLGFYSYDNKKKVLASDFY